MGWLQDLAGKTPIKGQVVVTVGGESTTYVNMEKAEEACASLKGKLRFFRGAFFATESMPRKAPSEGSKGPSKAELEKAAAEDEAKASEPPPPPEATKKKTRRRSSSE
jgi:hypothetical protein